MARTRLQPSTPADPVRYSHGFRVGNTVYLAGALGIEPDGSTLVQVVALADPNALIEIEGIAVLD